MAKIDGINVCGYFQYSDENGRGGMKTCGQVEIGGFGNWRGTDPAKFLESLQAKSYAPALNIVFSITGHCFLSGYAPSETSLLGYLLNHKNTRVMHWYKNDAHGPNWVFLCIYHKNLPDKSKCSPGYSVEEIRKRITYNQGIYGMKESE